MRKIKLLLENLVNWFTAYVNGEEIKKLLANEQAAHLQALQPVKLQAMPNQRYDPQSGIMLLENHQADSVVKQRINQANNDPAAYALLCHEVVRGGVLNCFHVIADDLYLDIGRLLLGAIYNENKYLSSRNEDYIPMNATDISIINIQKYTFDPRGLLLYYDLGKLNGEQKQQFQNFWKKATAAPFYVGLKHKYGFKNLKIALKNVTLIIAIE